MSLVTVSTCNSDMDEMSYTTMDLWDVKYKMPNFFTNSLDLISNSNMLHRYLEAYWVKTNGTLFIACYLCVKTIPGIYPVE